jgi:hypothetical protein
MGFGLVTGFIGLLKLVTANNYNNFTKLRTVQFTVVRTKSSVSSLCAAL